MEPNWASSFRVKLSQNSNARISFDRENLLGSTTRELLSDALYVRYLRIEPRELLLDALCVKLAARRTGAARLGRPMKLHRGTKKMAKSKGRRDEDSNLRLNAFDRAHLANPI